MPRVNLKSNLVRLDRRLPSSALRLIGRGLGQSGFGRLLARSDGYDDWQHMLSPHQMGTTRAHSSPKHGVVNADLKLHDLSNLYVAGASVFTTSGAANPTFSIVALALRLAAHLETKLRS
jgi:choline dehydrogenase-like flavoprotein